MIINKSKPVSLSMRMRTEAAKLPPERPSARSMSDSGSLPEIGPASMSRSVGSMPGTSNLPLGINYGLTRPIKKDPGYQEIETERHSGIKDYLESGAVFADRTKMTMPTASCVRCGEHASTCMSCTEFLAEEALNFYRKTRARGAASLFANAITQTGITTVVKYIVYSLWKNSFYNRKWSAKKKAFKAELICRRRYMAMCFKPWTEFRTSNKVERRDKEIERLTKRVAALEAACTQATNLQKAAELKLGKIQKEKDVIAGTFDKQASKIEELKVLLATERLRVVGLSTLALPILKFDDLTADLSANESKELHRKLFMAAASQQTGFDYGKTFNSEDLLMLDDSEQKRREKNKKLDKAEELDEDVEMVGLLLNWASSKSREAGSNIDTSTGKTLDSVLPKYKKVSTFDDFKNGATLMRVVIGLLWDTPQPGHTTLKLASTALVPDGMTVEGAGDRDPEDVLNQNEVLKEMKASLKTPFEMISCALSLARKHLAFPSFAIGDLVSCNPGVYTAVLGYLMLASASPAQSTGNLAKVSALINSYERASGKAEYARRQIQLKHVQSIKKAWAALHGLEEAAADCGTDSAAQQGGDSSEVAEAKEKEDAGEKASVSSEAADEPDAVSKVDADGESTVVEVVPAEVEVKTTEAVEELTEGLSLYSTLAHAVDAYIEQLGEADPEKFTYEKLEGPMAGQITNYHEILGELGGVRLSVDEHLLKVEQGFRVANKARMTVSRFQFELFANELSWLE